MASPLLSPIPKWDQAAYTQLLSKLLSNIKEEFQRNMIEQKFKEFEEYEMRKFKMKQWEKKKDKQIKQARRVSRQQKKLDKELKARKRENGEKAFREWLRRSMGRWKDTRD